MPDKATRVYLAAARHERFDHPKHAFTMKVPMVRVALPKSGRATIDTEYGSIGKDDRLLRSVADVRDKICDAEGIAYPERVELISPPRRGMRFGAIAIYLGYAKGAKTPYFYVLEAGLATGQPKELFIGKTMTTSILQRSNYEPTPFSSSNNWYLSAFNMKSATSDEPGNLIIEVKKTKSAKRHTRVDIAWTKVTSTKQRADLQKHNPLGLILNAASRVEAIAEFRTEHLGKLGIFQPFANVLGKNQKWEVPPHD